MSAAVTEVPAVSAQTLEHVLATGDLSKLTPPQRLEYYTATCRSLGLNPLTRPFRFLSLNNQIQMYATRDCTDQLRKIQGITLHVVDKQIDGDLFIVTVRARTKDGREDEDIGAVTLGQLRGESRANALMKGLTKAKRRVTLSVCGLGLTDEAELDTMPGAQVFDAEDTPPPARISKAPEAPSRREEINQTVPLDQPSKMTWTQLLDSFDLAIKDAATADEITHILRSPQMTECKAHIGKARPEYQRRYDEIMRLADERLAALQTDTTQTTWESDPIGDLLLDIAQMDAITLAGLQGNAAWRAKVKAAAEIPQDEDRIRDAIEARQLALKGGGKA